MLNHLVTTSSSSSNVNNQNSSLLSGHSPVTVYFLATNFQQINLLKFVQNFNRLPKFISSFHPSCHQLTIHVRCMNTWYPSLKRHVITSHTRKYLVNACIVLFPYIVSFSFLFYGSATRIKRSGSSIGDKLMKVWVCQGRDGLRCPRIRKRPTTRLYKNLWESKDLFGAITQTSTVIRQISSSLVPPITKFMLGQVRPYLHMIFGCQVERR
jgi:hypothetical protein